MRKMMLLAVTACVALYTPQWMSNLKADDTVSYSDLCALL